MAKKVGVLLKMFLFQEDIYSLPQVNLETKKTLRVHVITSSISRDLCIEDSQRCRDEKRVECHRQESGTFASLVSPSTPLLSTHPPFPIFVLM